MFKLIILFILVAVFSIFALGDFLGLWAYVREGLEYFNKVLSKNIKILEEIASGSRQCDILKLYEKSSISNVIRQFDFPNLYELESFPYEKVEIKNNLYVWVNDTFVKLRNKFKKATKYRFRLVTFHTVYKFNFLWYNFNCKFIF